VKFIIESFHQSTRELIPNLTAITYMIVRNGCLRDAEKRCMENMELLRRFGWIHLTHKLCCV